jgi:hypothetical protein
MSNSAQGTVLAGQPVAVTAGSGITIDPSTGVISVNAATVSGLVKLNNPTAFNAYFWPTAKGTADQFLQTDASGNLTWADAAGFAVVTVSNFQPAPPQEGELWFDCSTGTLKIYQTCVAPGGWTATDQSGLPALPGNVTATPPFTGGSGTLASPFDCTVTTTGAGTTTYVINSVKIVGFVPFQYVPIVDLDAFANGGRFSFSNYYADAAGELFFQTIFTDAPASPSGTSYTAQIKVGYGTVYIDAIVNVVSALVVTGGTITGPSYVGQQLTYTPGAPSGGQAPYGSPTIKWFANGVQIGGAAATTFTLTGAQLGANITASTTYTDAASQTSSGTSNSLGPVLAAPAALNITSPGSIAPTAAVLNTVLNYTAGTFAGGIPTVTPTWVWQRNGTNITGTANATSYTVAAADINAAITVRYTVTDSATPIATTVSASTAAVTPTQPIPGGTWSPSPNLNTDALGPSSGAWNGSVPATMTASGCVEVSLDGSTWGASVSITTAAQTVYQQWKPSCVGQKSGDTITGSVTVAGVGINNYSIQLDHNPSNVLANISDTNVALGATVSKVAATSVSGINAPAYVTLGSGSTGTSISASTSAAGPWTALAATGTGFQLLVGQDLYIQQVVGTSTGVGYTANIQVGDDPAVAGAVFSSFTYTATTTTSAALPTSVYNPTLGQPNASPYTVTYNDPGTLGQLYGKSASGWLGATTTTLTPGANTLMSIGAGVPGSAPISAANGNIVNVAVDPTYAGGLNTGNTATATFTSTYGGVNYTNSFSFVVEKGAAFTVPAGASGASGTIAIASQNVTNINVPVKLYQTPGTPAITSVTVDINGNGPVPLPTSIGTALTLNPGDTVAFSGTVAAGATTYTTDIKIGDTTETWSYEVTVTPVVTQPNITLPTAPATNLNPALNSPAGITIATPTAGNAGGYIDNYGGSQVKSTWTVYKGGYPLGPSTNTISVVTPGTPGSPTTTQLKTSATTDTNPPSQNEVYGKPATDTFTGTAYPALDWARGLNIGGFTDWYIPAKNELEILYFNLKPTTASNNNASGINLNAVPSRASFYGATPTQTSNALFQSGGSQAFIAAGYMSTTEDSGLTSNAWRQTFSIGQQASDIKDRLAYARAIRRIPIAEYTAAGSPAIGSSLAGGYYGGLISTAGNGTADYALIVAPLPTGTFGYTGGTNASLTIAGADTDGFIAGLTIKGSPSNATGIILSINSTTIQYLPVSGTFAVNDTISTDPASYTAVTGFNPKVVTSAPFNSVLIPQADLSTSSTYYASVIYTGSGTPNVDSTASAWKTFTTASSFLPAPGTAMDGGYFGGQINDGGIIYNLIVAPKASGQSTTNVQYKTSASADTPSATFQNLAYGFPASQAGNDINHPAFQFARNLTISGYNDWYIPAKNELAIIYYNLKPSATANDTTSGSNSNSISPYTPNTNYSAGSPGPTTSTLFQTTGSESYSSTDIYWSSSEEFSFDSNAWGQWFSDGYQILGNKNVSRIARAIRRTYANAPVAIGAAYGGGYFAGQYVDGGTTYNLIVAPIVSGGLIGEYSTNGGVSPDQTAYRNPNGVDGAVAQNSTYGKPATDAFDDANHQAFTWCNNSPTGPNAGASSGGTGIGGFNDWYVPALNEMILVVQNLGYNWTTATDFKQPSGSQRLTNAINWYWTATENSSSTTSAWQVSPSTLATQSTSKDNGGAVRAVRRVVA